MMMRRKIIIIIQRRSQILLEQSILQKKKRPKSQLHKLQLSNIFLVLTNVANYVLSNGAVSSEDLKQTKKKEKKRKESERESLFSISGTDKFSLSTWQYHSSWSFLDAMTHLFLQDLIFKRKHFAVALRYRVVNPFYRDLTFVSRLIAISGCIYYWMLTHDAEIMYLDV